VLHGAADATIMQNANKCKPIKVDVIKNLDFIYVEIYIKKCYIAKNNAAVA
jgi:hypothetical protein